jgi:hypothetical protein
MSAWPKGEAGVVRRDEQRWHRHSCSVTRLGWGRKGGGVAGPAEGSGSATGQGWVG